ncbi:unnamed protein product, partial [Rotaria socialis]
MKLPVGLKARYPDHWKDFDNTWPKHMYGREITVYILLYECTSKTHQTMLYSNSDLSKAKGMINWDLSNVGDIYPVYELTPKDQISLERYLDYVDQA